ncbi:cation-translocating P-type ATPase [Halodesulfovibrio marinisediminis]|uniref:Ca2+-transporting ATPase n=1 Tax=Halodesulfovibrio marinisediminis DSM 17456 TaxID=1121457 RepID=A0A1N6I863_9BACT|nr:HAD-IC family P-type ATPase [Halodesulfovibrio marinisediminis]SIO28207.1 Ca2+-transporting ATPase [Halodesulfovibrio marinisediminis DSM 17456]
MSWYRNTIDEIFSEFSTGPDGLTIEQAEELRKKYGDNTVGKEDKVNYLELALHQLKSPLIFILLIAGAVTFALGEYGDTIVILSVIVLNGLIGFVQEAKAEQSVRSLQRMVTPKTIVVRDGKEKEVESISIVPGDIISLISGSMVPADIRLFSTTELRVDESMLTGESLPAVKNIAPILEEDLSPGDQVNMAFMGTIVVNGRARGVVVSTGEKTMLGTIARDIRSASKVVAPIQEKIERLAKLIGLLVLAAATGLFILGLFLGESVKAMFLAAVAAAVATVPEGLPIVVTIALAVGVNRMVKNNAVIRKLPAVETLGSTTTICSDKTGTLTVNRMTVTRLFDGEKDIAVSGIGYEPEGEFVDERNVPVVPDNSMRELLRVGLLCNESRLIHKKKYWEVEGDPTEGALIVSAMKAGMTVETERHSWPSIAILPFESERGYMATLHEHEGEKYLFVKGGHDRLMELCTGCLYQEGMNRQVIQEKAKEYAAEGMRVLAFAIRKMPKDAITVTDDDVTKDLMFIGLQGMIDPPRPEAIEAVANCHNAGIRVIMITGDHADTATAIARILGLDPPETGAISGVQLAHMTDEELEKVVHETTVFARIAPDDKFRIVNALKKQQEIVAVTGDGVNDAPALKTAHIGIAMGKGGTDVAREASDMVLVDDNFSSIFHAVREGRIVFDNLRKAIFFLLPTGLAAIWSILLTMLTGIPIPYVPAQLLWINLVTNGLQDVAFAFEPGEKGIEDRPPRPTNEGIINKLLIQRTVIVSLCIATGVFFVFKGALVSGLSIEKSRTMAMTTMVLFQFFQAFNARSEYSSIFAINPFSNRFLFVSMILALSAQVWVVSSGSLEWIFRTRPLSGSEWMTCFAVAASVILVVELDKFARRRWSKVYVKQ